MNIIRAILRFLQAMFAAGFRPQDAARPVQPNPEEVLVKFDMLSILKLLPAVGPVIAALPEFRKVYDQIVGTFKPQDQQVLKDAYNDLMLQNDEGHERLQRKLAEAAKQ